MRYITLAILIAATACTTTDSVEVVETAYTEKAVRGSAVVSVGGWVSDTQVKGTVVMGDSLADITVKSATGFRLHLGTAIEAGTADMLVEVETGNLVVLPMVRVPCTVNAGMNHFHAICSAATDYGLVSVRTSIVW